MINKMLKRICILRIVQNGFDGENIFVDVIVGTNLSKKKPTKNTLILSKQVTLHLIKALCDGLEQKDFKSKKSTRRLK